MPKVRLLLVDDEEAFVTTLAERLEARGYETHVVHDGERALAFLRDSDVDVVVLDVGLPGLSGLDVLEEIKSVRPYAQVVMLTGTDDVSTAVAGMKLGATDYLVKPAPMEMLVTSLESAKTRRAVEEEGLRMQQIEKLASLGVLAEGVAHEINNPVNIMVNEAGWISELLEGDELKDLPEKADIQRAVETIKRQGKRCRAITEKLQALGGRIDPKPRETDLSRLIPSLAEKAQERAEILGVTIRTEVGQGLPVLACSPSDLEKALQNIVDNALDAMETTGGVLHIAVGMDESEVVITVTDSGLGMEPATLARIFEPFFSTKKVGKGMGLGLSITHCIVKTLGGSVCASGTPRVGAAFTVRLPVPARK